MNPRIAGIARGTSPWSSALATLVLPVLFASSVIVVHVFVSLPSVALVALLLVAVAASVAVGGKPSGITGVAAALTWAWTEVTPFELATLAGAGAGIVAIVSPLRDAIARSDEVRRASADAREWLRQIVDRMPDPVIVWDRAGRVAFINESAIALIGTPPADAVDVMRVLAGEDVRAKELRVTDPAGTERVLAVAASPLRTAGTIIGAVATFSDLTEMKSLEQERSDFYAMLGHEIKTPLSAVYGQAQMVRRLVERGGSAERLRHAVVELDAAIARMRALTTEIGDLTTMRAGRFVLNPREIDLGLIVRSALARNAARSDRHTLDLALPEHAVLVSCDEFRVEQVMDNLIANAVQYSPGGGRVELRVSVEGSDAFVRIADSGIGVPPADRERIFEPFFRASNARSRHGTGLGLAISRDIIRRSGGDVWLDRSGDDGSTFAVRLPLVRSGS